MTHDGSAEHSREMSLLIGKTSSQPYGAGGRSTGTDVSGPLSLYCPHPWWPGHSVRKWIEEAFSRVASWKHFRVLCSTFPVESLQVRLLSVSGQKFAGPGTGAMATAPPPPPALCRGVAEAIAGGSWQAATATGMTDRWNKIALLDGPGCPQADLYEWLPSSCRLERRARKSFCGRHIAFIGDSLLEQSFTSLSLMLKSLPGIRCQTRKVLGAWVESFECVAGNATCSITLSYVLSRFLCFDDCQRTLSIAILEQARTTWVCAFHSTSWRA